MRSSPRRPGRAGAAPTPSSRTCCALHLTAHSNTCSNDAQAGVARSDRGSAADAAILRAPGCGPGGDRRSRDVRSGALCRQGEPCGAPLGRTLVASRRDRGAVREPGTGQRRPRWPTAEPGRRRPRRPTGAADARRHAAAGGDRAAPTGGPAGRRGGGARRPPGPGRPAGSGTARRDRPSARGPSTVRRPGRAPATGTATGTDTARPAPAGRRVRVLIAALLVPCALATLVGVVLLWPSGGPPPTAAAAQQPVRAEVVATRAAECSPGAGSATAAPGGRADGRRAAGRAGTWCRSCRSSRARRGSRWATGWCSAGPAATPTIPGPTRSSTSSAGSPLLWLAVAFAAAVLLLGPLARAGRAGRARAELRGAAGVRAARRSWPGTIRWRWRWSAPA